MVYITVKVVEADTQMNGLSKIHGHLIGRAAFQNQQRRLHIMYQIDFNHPVSVFFVGIGGISMSGLAQILASEGFTVSGSDRS